MFFSARSSQFRSGGGGGMQTSGYDGSQFALGVGEIVGGLIPVAVGVGDGVEVGNGAGVTLGVKVLVAVGVEVGR